MRGGIPYIRIYCNEDDYLSVRDSNGLTYTEGSSCISTESSELPVPEANSDQPILAFKTVSEAIPDGIPHTGVSKQTLTETTAGFEYNNQKYYMFLQTEGTEMTRKEVWIPRKDVCPLERGPTQTRFGQVPAEKGIKAYVSHPHPGLVEETMTFCPAEFDRWIAFDDDRIAQGIHYRDLHVEIGGSPSEQQEGAISTILESSDINAATGLSRGVMWLGNFLTATMIHESTHSKAFAGSQNTLSMFLPSWILCLEILEPDC